MFKSDTFKTLLFAISYCPVVVQGHMYDHVIAQAHTLTTYLVTLSGSQGPGALQNAMYPLPKLLAHFCHHIKMPQIRKLC